MGIVPPLTGVFRGPLGDGPILSPQLWAPKCRLKDALQGRGRSGYKQIGLHKAKLIL